MTSVNRNEIRCDRIGLHRRVDKELVEDVRPGVECVRRFAYFHKIRASIHCAGCVWGRVGVKCFGVEYRTREPFFRRLRPVEQVGKGAEVVREIPRGCCLTSGGIVRVTRAPQVGVVFFCQWRFAS